MNFRVRVMAGSAALGALIACAGPAGADPIDPFVVPAPPPPIVTYPVAPVANGAAMTPRQQTVPAADPAGAPVLSPGGIPEIQNPVYGSGNSGGGIFGTLKDLWNEVKNPAFVPDEIMGANSGLPATPGAAAVPPGGVPAAGPADSGTAPRPALPPGYYPLDGPPPPGYEFVTPGPALPTP